MAVFKDWGGMLEDALAEPFPHDVIQQKQKGGTRIDFVAWHHYARKLNHLVGGGWSIGTPVTMELTGGKFIVGLPVTIFGTTRINFGSEDEDKDDYGDAATNAWAQAFKRTLALFGMGLDMYDKRPPAARSNGGNTPSVDQLQLIEKLQKSSLITDTERTRLKRSLEKVNTRDQASLTVDWLVETIKQRKVAADIDETEAGVRG